MKLRRLTEADIVIVNANKPKFFEEGSTLREIDIKTGKTTLVPVKAFLPQKVLCPMVKERA